MYWHLIPVPFALFVIHRCLPARRRNNLERVAVVASRYRSHHRDRCPLPVIFPWGVVGVGLGGAHTKYPAVRIELCDLL